MSELSLWESTVTVPFDFRSNGYVASLSDGRVLLSGSLNTSGDFAREFLTMNADGSVSRALTDVFTGEGNSTVTAALANGNFVTCFASDSSGAGGGLQEGSGIYMLLHYFAHLGDWEHDLCQS